MMPSDECANVGRLEFPVWLISRELHMNKYSIVLMQIMIDLTDLNAVSSHKCNLSHLYLKQIDFYNCIVSRYVFLLYIIFHCRTDAFVDINFSI